MGNIDFLHGSSGDLLHGRQPGMDQIVAMWVPFFFFFFSLTVLINGMTGLGLRGHSQHTGPCRHPFFFFLFLPPW